MRPQRVPIPNGFTMEPTVHISIERSDGTRDYRTMTLSEFQAWQEAGSPEEWFEDDDSD